MSDEQKEPDRPTDTSLNVPQIKVKQEKFDPEVEAKINAITIPNVIIKREFHNEHKSLQSNAEKGEFSKTDVDDNVDVNESGDDGDSSVDNNVGVNNNNKYNPHDSNGKDTSLDEDKKSITPVKSSNEILAELFQVFNAAPPEELLDDESLLKKSHKHKKHKKEKKNKIKREKDISGGEGTCSDSEESNLPNDDKEKKYKHKHKKRKKHKHKDAKDKVRGKSNDKGKKDKEKSKERQTSKERSFETVKDTSKPSSPKHSRTEPKYEHHQDSRSHKRQSDTKSMCTADSKKVRTECEHIVTRHKSSEIEKHGERDRDKDTIRVQNFEKNREKNNTRDHKHNSFYNGFPEYESNTKTVHIKKEPKETTIKRDTHDGHISEISLSDEEEDYLKDRHVSDDTKHRRFGHDYANERSSNSFYAGLKRSRSRDRDRNRNRDRERERDRNYRGDGRSHSKRRSRSRGRSRSRSRDLGIDKKRLLEIARKNAISMFKRGNLPGCDSMSQEVKDKVLLKMRYGGKTVQDLTDFCKKISNGENLSDLSSDEDSDVDKSGNTKAFHHPFQLKEREPIVMHIRNATTLPLRPTSNDAVKAITMQFPVSSGERHRMTEAWVPVVQKDNLPPLPTLPAVAQSTTMFKTGVVKNVFEKAIPEEQQEPAFKPVQQSSVNTNGETNCAVPNTVDNSAIPVASSNMPAQTHVPMHVHLVKPLADAPGGGKPLYAVPPPSVTTGVSPSITSYPPIQATVLPPVSIPPPPIQQIFVPDVPVPSSADAPVGAIKVFHELSGPQLDVSSIISKRLQAMRRLQENPMDPEAIKMMYNSQKDMSSWASSKHLPGQFTGSTGANILSMRELNSGPQAWARRDQLITSRPVSGGMGMQLLQKMGWKPGEGLGRDKTGSLQPLLLDVKLDKHGLVARDDNNGYKQKPCKKQRPQNNIQQQQQELLEKHPVCLLNELTSKRKWTPPLYTLVNEAGPSHSRMFLFSVSINGHTYTPTQGSNTKKEAKLISARHCLQQMGILPM
ncbi:protein Son isoform X1 [Zeugodacus cucurbitae]|uniref:Protein SON n=1 Tax=Zeugodacus cucurbitae TaxID=28588 RepID=A0A0A1X2Q6_ZEUCU|nr:protein Son isoform X1 [Zeugodacus cucurbitae]